MTGDDIIFDVIKNAVYSSVQTKTDI